MARERVVDTHVHVVSADIARYPLNPAGLPGAWYRERPVTTEQLCIELAGAGVEKAVLVQAVGAYSYDNAYAADSARADPQRFRGACALDAKVSGAASTLRDLVAAGGISSVRVFALAPPGQSRVADPATLALWQTAHELGIPAIATVFEHQLGELGRLLAALPDLPVALDHCGFPDLGAADWEKRSALMDLARFPNLSLKVSSHLLHSARDAGRSPAHVVALLAERFGAERLMWGSDYSQTPGPYAELVELGRAACASVGAAARERILAGSALEMFFSAPAR
jgi:predicted TIM-barrel fold metal-dependent hydrolase